MSSQVNITGENKPKPLTKFSDAGLNHLVNSNIKRAGYSVPTPVQKYALPAIMDGRDLMACAQTGSGKTAAFLLPIIHKLVESGANGSYGDGRVAPQAVIITPTRELGIQIYDEARKFSGGCNITSQVVYGGTSVSSQIQNLSRGCHILVATPGRLLDFVERGRITFAQVQFLILDEADRMLGRFLFYPGFQVKTIFICRYGIHAGYQAVCGKLYDAAQKQEANSHVLCNLPQ